MANCSFIKATEARNNARNNTLIWTEICEVQTAILAAIDANQYSTIVAGGTPFTTLEEITAAVLVNGGSGYSIESATAAIDANGTGGTLATVTPIVTGQTITSFTVDNGGSGYAPVSATAVVGDLYELRDDLVAGAGTGQNETHFDNSPTTEGTFTAGQDYRVGEVISLSDGSTVTVNTIAGIAEVTIISQDETDFDGLAGDGTFVGGDGVGGTAYQAGTTITMSDGSVILVDTVDVNGDVVTFDITTASTSSFPTATTLTQVSAQSTGLGFTITTTANNEISVGTVATFLLRSPGTTPFNWPSSVTQASTDGIGRGFVVIPDTGNLNTVSAGAGGVLTPVVTNGVVTNIVINSPGTGYLSGAPVSIVHPNGAGATALIGVVGGSGDIQSITIVNGGSGYETANALVTVTHSTGQNFAGTVQVTAGVVTGISIQDGGTLYANLFPTIVVNDASGTGANINVTGVSAGAISSIQLTDGGSGYSQTPSLTYFNADGTQHAISSEDITLTVESNTFGTDPQEYYSVLSGQATDAVIADQIQYVLDYFNSLGYNTRAQVNPATGDTMQWQIIW